MRFLVCRVFNFSTEWLFVLIMMFVIIMVVMMVVIIMRVPLILTTSLVPMCIPVHDNNIPPCLRNPRE